MNLPTAEEFLKNKLTYCEYKDVVYKEMIEFAKLHVEAQAKEIVDKAKLLKFYVLKCEDPAFYYKNEDDENSYIHRDTNGTVLGLDTVEIDKESILNAYPLTNIK